jgi:uncharacterized membrane protein (TIGR02234 family)
VPSRRLAVLLILAGALLVILASTRTWASIGLRDLTGLTDLSVPGRKAAPAGLPIGLAALAGMFVLATAGRWIRITVALALVVGGIYVALRSIQVSNDAMAALTDQLRDSMGIFTSDNVIGASALSAMFANTQAHVTAWPWVAAAGGALIALAGLVVLVRGSSWPAPGQRFERAPAGAAPSRPAPASDSPAGTWDALSRGEDPT